MRKDNPIHLSYFSNAAVSGCKTTSGTDCIETLHNSLSVGTSHTISHANFILTSSYFGSTGGAISLNGGLNKASTSLEVSHSTFTECYATEGAGIYVNGISSIKVSSSLFYNCGNISTERGGGICMRSVSSHYIIDNHFVSLRSSYDAGALLFSECTQNYKSLTVNNNRFLLCKCSGTEGSSGGAVEAWSNACPRFGNCLFSQCSGIGGGSLWLFGVYPSPTLSFSFFHNNTGTSEYGHDCRLADGGGQNVFLHCFSETHYSPRVSPPGHDNDWLL